MVLISALYGIPDQFTLMMTVHYVLCCESRTCVMLVFITPY